MRNGKKWLSLALAVCMVWTMLPLSGFASDGDGLCAHHPAHTAECGYAAASEGAPCGHEHTEDCYVRVTSCVHQHAAECYSDGLLPAEGEGKAADACAHVCSEENGCVTEELNCQHAHDEACGYAPATEGAPCGYVCEICNGTSAQSDGEADGAENPPACTCADKCADGAVNVDCPVCANDFGLCTGMEQQPAPACTCTDKCAEGDMNGDCPVCANDSTLCTGAEQQPTCTCADKCAEGAVNGDCPVCANDSTLCTGTEQQPAPTCTCADKCAEGAVNADCPVCAEDFSLCAGAEALAAVEKVQAMIDALPPLERLYEMDDGALQAAMEQYAAAHEAYAALTAEQRAQISGAEALEEFAALMNAGAPLANEKTENSVAQVDMNGETTYYDTLYEAVNAVGRDTAIITLLKNASLTDWNYPDIYGNITLVGGAYTISGYYTNINVYGSLSIDSGTYDETVSFYADGTIYINGGSVYYVDCGGTVEVNAGAEISSLLASYGKTTIKGGTIDVLGRYGGAVDVYGGTIGSIQGSSGSLTYHVTALALDKSTLALVSGATETLTATVTPSMSAPNLVTWESSDTAVATVSTNGTVTAVAPGTATITATAGEKTAICTVTVKPYATISAAPSANTNLSYSGSAQALVTAGAAQDGTMLYALGDALGATGAYSETVPQGTNAGTYHVWYYVEGNENYSSTTPARVDVTIGKRSITITPDSGQSKVYGEADPALTYAVGGDGLVSGDALTGALTREVGEDVGNYAITQGTLTDENNPNYAITFTKDVLFEIKHATQGTLNIEGNPTTVTYGDFFTLRTYGGSGEGTVAWEVSDSSYASVDANGKVTVHGVGEVTITATKAGGNNYEEATAEWTFTVQKKPVTAVLSVTAKPYDGNRDTTVTATVAEGDLVSGDSIAITGLTGTFADANVGANKTVTVNTAGAQISGTNSDCYAVTIPATATGEITAIALTGDVTIDGTAKYGQQLTASYTGAASGETLTYTWYRSGTTDSIATGSTYVLEEIDIGKTITVRVTASNHSGDVSATTAPVSKADGSIAISCASVVYGAAVSPSVVSNVSGGAVSYTYVGTGETTYAPSSTPPTEVGTYSVTATAAETATHTQATSAAVEFSITQRSSALSVSAPVSVIYGGDLTITVTVQDGEGNTIPTATGTVTLKNGDETLATSSSAANGVYTLTCKAGRELAIGGNTLTITYSGDSNVGGNEDTATVTLTPKAVTSSVDGTPSKTYDGKTDITVNLAVNDLEGGDSFSGTVSGSFDSAGAGTDKPITLGDNPVWSDTETAGYYSIALPTGVTGSIMAKDIAGAEIKLGNALTYSGSEQEQKVASVMVDGLEVTYTVSGNKATDAGKYNLTVRGNGNFKGTATKAWSIAQAENEWTTGLSITGWTYGESANAPTAAAKFGSVSFSYGSSADGAFAADVPTNAGTWYVKASVAETNNYTDLEAVVSFAIGKAALSDIVDPTAQTLTYNGAEQALVTAGSVEDGEMLYSLNNLDYSANIPTGKDAETYRVYWKVECDDNHSDAAGGSVEVTIKPLTAELLWSGYDNLTYTGKAVSVTAEVGNLVAGDSCTVTVEGGAEVNAGAYTASATALSNDNYTLPEGATQEYSIGKATLTVSATAESKTYDGGTEATGSIILTGAVNGEQPSATGTFAFEGANAADGKKVNVTDIALDGDWGDNYVLNATSTTTTADIAPLTVELVWSGYENLIYTGKAVNVTATVGNLIGNDACTVTVEGGNEVNAGGPYTATATALDNDNYTLEGCTNSTQAYSIGKGKHIAPVSGEGYEIDYVLESIAADEDFELATAKGESGEASLQLTPGTNVFVRRAEDGNHDASDWTEVTIPARPAAPSGAIVVRNKTGDSITVEAVSGQEYSLNELDWNTSGAFGGLKANTPYTVYARVSAVAGQSFASESISRTVQTLGGDGSGALNPGESVTTEDGTIVTNDGEKVTITDEDGTETTITLPEGTDDVSVGAGGGVEVPGGSEVSTGDTTVTVGEDGGTVNSDGSITLPEDGSVSTGDTTITTPGGGTVAPDGEGGVDVPGGSEVTTGDTTVTVGEGGGTVNSDGSITLPSGGSVSAGDTTITTPDGGTVAPDGDGGVDVPGGSEVTTGESGTTVALPDGGSVGADGSITLPSGGSATISKGEESFTITTPSGGAIAPDGEGGVNLPGGATVQTGDGATVTLPDNGGKITAGGVLEYDVVVTFDSRGGSSVPSQTLTVGYTAVKPADPTRKGYTFGGWYAEGSASAWDFASPVPGNMTLTARWTANEETLTPAQQAAKLAAGEAVESLVTDRFGEPMPYAPFTFSTVDEETGEVLRHTLVITAEPVLDANGEVVLDENGEPLYEQRNLHLSRALLDALAELGYTHIRFAVKDAALEWAIADMTEDGNIIRLAPMDEAELTQTEAEAIGEAEQLSDCYRARITAIVGGEETDITADIASLTARFNAEPIRELTEEETALCLLVPGDEETAPSVSEAEYIEECEEEEQEISYAAPLEASGMFVLILR